LRFAVLSRWRHRFEVLALAARRPRVGVDPDDGTTVWGCSFPQNLLHQTLVGSPPGTSIYKRTYQRADTWPHRLPRSPPRPAMAGAWPLGVCGVRLQ